MHSVSESRASPCTGTRSRQQTRLADRSGRPGLRLGRRRCGARRPARTWDRRWCCNSSARRIWANGGRPPNYAPTSAATFRALRDSRGPRYPWVQALADLERAEPGPLAASHDAGGLHLAPAQSRVHRDPRVIAGAAGRRAAARLRAARPEVSRRSPGCSACARPTRGSTPTRTTRIRSTRSARPRSAAAARSARRSRWRRSTGSSASWRETSRAPASGCRNTATRATRPTASSASRSRCRRATSREGEYVAYRTPRVDLLIHFLYRDEPELARFQSGLVTLGDKPKPALAAFEAPLAETSRTGARVGLWGQAGRSRGCELDGTHRTARGSRVAAARIGSRRRRRRDSLDRPAAARRSRQVARRRRRRPGTDDPLGVHRDVTGLRGDTVEPGAESPDIDRGRIHPRRRHACTRRARCRRATARRRRARASRRGAVPSRRERDSRPRASRAVGRRTQPGLRTGRARTGRRR